jgi:hypothetical protein
VTTIPNCTLPLDTTTTVLGEPGITVLWTLVDGECTRFLINAPNSTGTTVDPTGEKCE